MLQRSVCRGVPPVTSSSHMREQVTISILSCAKHRSILGTTKEASAHLRGLWWPKVHFKSNRPIPEPELSTTPFTAVAGRKQSLLRPPLPTHQANRAVLDCPGVPLEDVSPATTTVPLAASQVCRRRRMSAATTERMGRS